MYAERLAQLWSVENGLCFGRIDRALPSGADGAPGGAGGVNGPPAGDAAAGDAGTSGADTSSGPAGAGEGGAVPAAEARLYIGRIGLSDDDQERLLVDWRAPVAQPFYRATAASPAGLALRRHIRTRNRRVIGLDDDLFDIDALAEADRSTLNGEAALLASLAEHRTGRMRDIVATIQAEQDRVIRSGLPGVLVVEGGPGTGKTVVALHRAAYLLYTHRDKLSRGGVLIVGPSSTFLRYIGQVLPSLGETDVLLSTVGELFPGVTAEADEPDEVAALKGDARMAGVLARAVQDRQEPLGAPLELRVDRTTLRLDRRTVDSARTKARRSRRPHNQARRVFTRAILAALTKQAAKHYGADLLSEADVADLRAEIHAEPAVRSAINRLWPYLTPQRLLRELYADPARLASAAPELTGRERDLLRREPDAPWTPADVPLLDEAAELLGEIEESALRGALRAQEEESEEVRYAREVLAILGMEGVVDAAALAERHREDAAHLTLAERAAGDRSWTFGHVIVDEAQEVSAMAWRALMRRCPARSMTVVGDLAQAGTAAGPRTWAEALDPHAAGRWRLERLTVNYRTPSAIMDVAADALAAVGPGLEPPRSVRQGDEAPWSLRVDDLAAALPGVVAAEAAALGQGRLALIVPAALAERLAPLGVTGPEGLDAPVAVLTVAQAKGLEFDGVVIAEPAAVLAESPRGPGDLYVALTRATRRLGVVHTTDLPPFLSRLTPRRETGRA
ncbi:helicase [Bailinhaonella thermotolerans]|uniref:Helicase n=2 Tax=Bailinhaonella thermotolerans TaxID=1070861 RepID=A0A3A4B0G7_9ACTN|nr:helicase [Bailinhaonella thermotolerans]